MENIDHGEVHMCGIKSSEELLKERMDRLVKAYLNKTPDRVPFVAPFPSIQWAAKYTGVTTYDICFNYDIQVKVQRKLLADFNIDGIDSPPAIFPGLDNALAVIAFIDYPEIANSLFLITGPIHDILRDKYTRWPGRELSVMGEPQFIGGEFMRPDEYKQLIEKPIDFLNEVIIPRVFESLSNPRSPRAIAALIKAGREVQKYQSVSLTLSSEYVKYGWPTISISIFGIRPLDYISDHLRHPTNVMKDLYRRPDEVKQATEVITELAIKHLRLSLPPLIELAKKMNIPFVTVGLPLHLNSMLSPKMYNEFYWPSLKRVILEIINLGAMPWIFFEGDHTPHLETLLELPKGKVFGLFEKTDLRTVRRVIGDHMVISGGISPTLLAYGTREKVYDEVCKLLNDVKEPGGFIFSGTGVALPIDAKFENIIAAAEAVKKCGVYS